MGKPHGLGHGSGDDSTANPEYPDKVADFGALAAKHGLHVLPSLDVFPRNAHHTEIVGDIDPEKLNISGYNLVYMVDGYVRARVGFMKVLASEMRARLGPPMSTFLALQLDKEAHFKADQKPFNVTKGTVTGPDGAEYDKSDRKQRQAASDEWDEIDGPVINGESGALRERYGNDVNEAATAMRKHQVKSRELGMTGWLFGPGTPMTTRPSSCSSAATNRAA